MFKENGCAVVPGQKASVVVDVQMLVVSQLFGLSFFLVFKSRLLQF